MKKFLTAFACLCLALAGFAQDISKELDAAIAAYVKAGKFNGAVLVAKGGSILLNKGYGVSEATTQKPNTENSIFQIGSVTKQFTTA